MRSTVDELNAGSRDGLGRVSDLAEGMQRWALNHGLDLAADPEQRASMAPTLEIEL